MNSFRRTLYILTDSLLFVAGVVNLAVGTWSAVHQSAAIAVTSLTAGLVLLFAATIDRFESLKGLGIEAKTRKLDQKIEQADDALKRLRELTELTGATLIDLNAKMGRFDSAPSPGEAYALAQRVRSIMQGLGSGPGAIRRSLKPWALMTCRDLAYALTRSVNDAVNAEIQRLSNERSAIRQPVDPKDPNYARLNDRINALHGYRDKALGKLYEIELDGFPDRFMQLFDNVPLSDQSVVRSARAKAMEFISGMRALREDLSFENPDLWFREIEASRKQ